MLQGPCLLRALLLGRWRWLEEKPGVLRLGQSRALRGSEEGRREPSKLPGGKVLLLALKKKPCFIPPLTEEWHRGGLELTGLPELMDGATGRAKRVSRAETSADKETTSPLTNAGGDTLCRGWAPNSPVSVVLQCWHSWGTWGATRRRWAHPNKSALSSSPHRLRLFGRFPCHHPVGLLFPEAVPGGFSAEMLGLRWF